MAWSRKRRWTDDQLREAIASSTSFREAASRLGSIESRKGVHLQARKLGLDTSHFAHGRERKRRWTDDQLRSAVAASRSIAQTIRSVGLVPAGGNFAIVTRRIRDLGLDVSHMTGKGWNVGGVFRPRPATPLSEVLVANRWTTSHELKLRLIRAGLKEARCEICGWAEQAADGRIPVELDHINGDRDDNRLVNLRILCPNCHSLQPTHRGLNRRSVRRRRG